NVIVIILHIHSVLYWRHGHTYFIDYMKVFTCEGIIGGIIAIRVANQSFGVPSTPWLAAVEVSRTSLSSCLVHTSYIQFLMINPVIILLHMPNLFM
ncbi:hypothetical protein L9F63_000063, partial [Diploptera punctata]